MDTINIKFIDDYFISNEHKYFFCLLELDGECRARHLGVEDDFFENPELVVNWYHEIKKVIESSNFDDLKKQRAMKELNELYGELK